MARKSKTERRIVFVDVETTGLDEEFDDILEIAIVPLTPEGEAVAWHSSTLVRYTGEIPHFHVGRYLPEQLAAAPTAEEALSYVLHQLRGVLPKGGELIIGGSNPAFDLGFLDTLVGRFGVELPPIYHRTIDTRSYLHLFRAVGRCTSAGLDSAPEVSKLLSMPDRDHAGRHTALYDALLAADIYLGMRRMVAQYCAMLENGGA